MTANDPAAFGDVPSALRPAPIDTSVITARIESSDVPHSIEIERAVLGACFKDDAESLATVMSRATAEDFYRLEHVEVWAAITDLVGQSAPVTRVTLMHHLGQAGQLAGLGGPAWLQAAYDAAPLAEQLPYYLRILRELTAQRLLRTSLLSASSDLAAGLQAVSAAETLRSRLDQLPHPYEDQLVPIEALTHDVIDDLDRRARDPEAALRRYIPTGYLDLDKVISGFERRRMVILFARSGMGKSTVALDWVRHAGLGGNSVAYYSLEMSANEIMLRLLTAEASSLLPQSESRVTLDKLTDHPERLTDADWDRLAKAVDRLSRTKIFIDDSAAATVSDIRAKSQAIKRAHGLDMIAVDHLGLLSLESGRRVSGPAEEMGIYSRGMKQIAKELDVVSLILAQPNRGYAARQDKHPVASDLRDSEKIFNDADIVIGGYRQDVDNPEERDYSIDLEVLKNRAGPSGDRKTFTWQGDRSRVVARSTHT